MTDANLRARALQKWSEGKDTQRIADELGVKEWRVYNALAVAKRQVLVEIKPTRCRKKLAFPKVPMITSDGFLVFGRGR